MNNVVREEMIDWDNNAVFYYRDKQMPFQQLLTKKALAFYDIKKDEKVLDVGCGAMIIPDNTIGIDFSSKMIDHAKKINPKGKYIIANAEKIPFDDNSFDVVICNGILHHAKAQGILLDVIREVNRVLKKGGRLCILDRQNAAIPNFFFGLRQPLKKIFKPSSQCSTRNELEFTNEDVDLITSNGFVLIKRKYIVSLPFQLTLIMTNVIHYILGHRMASVIQSILYYPALFFETVFSIRILSAEQLMVCDKK